MPKRSRKPSSDENTSAFEAVKWLTRDDPEPAPKNPAAVELGRLGGLKGGKARADSLSADERSEIARAAAAARWGKKRKS